MWRSQEVCAASYVFFVFTAQGVQPTCSLVLYEEVNRMPTVGQRWSAICSPTVQWFGLEFLCVKVLTAGMRSFLTSSTALLILISALAWESSTVIRTWRSSFRCSQFGFPLFCSSWIETEGEREVVSECDSVGVLEHHHNNTAYHRKWRREAGIQRKRSQMTRAALQSAIQHQL